jgi:hypothetical protein
MRFFNFLAVTTDLRHENLEKLDRADLKGHRRRQNCTPTTIAPTSKTEINNSIMEGIVKTDDKPVSIPSYQSGVWECTTTI